MIKIYTDGSCIQNPGNGGWAAIIFMNNEKITITGNKKNINWARSTNLYRLEICKIRNN